MNLRTIFKVQSVILLINGKKAGMRSYALIASVDPLVLLFHDGYVLTAMENYDNDFTVWD